VIRVRGLTLSRGGRELLRGAELALSPAERVALIGPNGCGKSTLLGALAGDVVPDAGSIDQPYKRVTRLSQALPVSEAPAWRYLIEGDEELAAAEHELALANARTAEDPGSREASRESEQAGMALAQAHARWMDAGGADAPARARALLFGLGFSEAYAESPVSALSGGWRMRLNLARALFCPGDLLLLDEPTNHLDLDAVIWLERWLTRLPSTIVIVSHDRDFLDKVVRACLQIEDGTIKRYAGGYSDFERQRSARQLQLQREQQSVADRREHLESFIRRFRAQANRARQVQSRLRTLERMAEVAAIRDVRGIDISLPPVGDCPELLLMAESLAAGYANNRVVQLEKLQVNRGDRIGILGRNGAGKTTLIRTLVGDLTPIQGDVQRSRALRVGYFAQQGVESLRDEESPLDHLQRQQPDEREQVLRDYLGRFGFRGDDAVRTVGPMSGGEKARLLLALLIWRKPQMLVLDEPTNHLDAQTRDALADALAEYDGALLLVSHDRYLLRASVDRLLIADAGELHEYDGDLDDYHEWTARRDRSLPSDSDHVGEDQRGPHPVSGSSADLSRAEAETTDRRELRRIAAERRSQIAARTRNIDAEIRKAESELQSIETELGQIELALQDPALYASGAAQKVAELNRRRAHLGRTKDQTETQWLELQERRDAAVASVEAPDRSH
jgi:ATP-binding cassette subfamily F protein 3